MSCLLCVQAPKGIDGHGGLVLDQRKGPQAHVMYRCAKCGQTYIREYEGGGEFAWTQVSRVAQAH